MGRAELASIYQDARERELNRPSKPPAPNEALELDMVGYRAKIERKFAQSHMNQSYQMRRVYPEPLNTSESDGVTHISAETAMLLANLSHPTDELGAALNFIPRSTPLLESLYLKSNQKSKQKIEVPKQKQQTHRIATESKGDQELTDYGATVNGVTPSQKRH